MKSEQVKARESGREKSGINWSWLTVGQRQVF